MKIKRLARQADLGGALSKKFSAITNTVVKSLGFHLGRVQACLTWIILIPACFICTAHAATAPAVTLAWDANPETDVTGYRLSYGTVSGVYANAINVGVTPTASVAGLTEGTTYYFMVTAVNKAGLQSLPSSEVSYKTAVSNTIGAGGLVNGSFESGYTGWTVTGNAYIESVSSPSYTATDGAKLASFNGNSAIDVPPNAVLSQTFATTPGTTYTLAFDMGVIGTVIAEQKLQVTVGGAGNVLSQIVARTKVAGSAAQWKAQSYRFVADSALATLTFRDISATTTEIDALLDNVRITALPSASNAAPVALANAMTTAEDTLLPLALGGTDADGNALTFSVVTAPANGTLSGTAPNLTYSPSANFNGSDSFTFLVNDGTVNSAPATVSITVTPVEGPVMIPNSAPAFAGNPISASATEDAAFSGKLIATDADAGDVLTFTKISGPPWLTVSTDGQLSGTPLNPNVGTNSFVVRVTDVIGAIAEAALNITVTNVNGSPAFIIDPIIAADTSEGMAYTGESLAGKALDPDAGDSITYSKVSGPDWLSVAPNGALSGQLPPGSAGLNTFIVRATDSSLATADAELRINVTGLPLPWTGGNLGTGQLAGSAFHHAGTFTQVGSGTLGGNSDKPHFVYQTLSGDGEIIARVCALQNTGTSSRVGVMIRETLASNSRQAFIGLSGTSSYRWVRRTSTGTKASTTTSGSGIVPNTWVRLVRAGSKITAYKSGDGTTWTSVGSTTTTMAANCYIGLAVSSGSNTTLNTSQFSNVSVTP